MKTILCAAVLAAASSAFPASGAVGARGSYGELLALTANADSPPPLAETPRLQDVPPIHVGVVSTRQLLNMRRKTLEELYKGLNPGPIPDGESDGVASREPGTELGRISQAVLGAFWQGKVFDRAHGVLVNRLATGEMIKAKVFYGDSWLDGKTSIIIDYQDTSAVAGFIRDEIREAAPGIYLGFAFERQDDGPARANIVFALDFNASK
jgi:hypothetical protein